MSIVITRDYREVDGEQRECYRINDQIVTNSSNLLNELHKIGADITAAQMKFIANKHSMPRRLYEDYGLVGEHMISVTERGLRDLLYTDGEFGELYQSIMEDTVTIELTGADREYFYTPYFADLSMYTQEFRKTGLYSGQNTCSENT